MRTIKFRGRTFNGTIWAYGLIDMLRFDDDTWHYYIREYKQNGGYTDYEVDHNTIGQFTGLYDKNGKEIYEGDILAWKSVVCEEDGVEIFFGKVTFTDGVFCVEEDWESSVERVLCDSEEYCIARVIGNIHDNPELM